MGFLMFLSRKISLQNQENDISYQLTSINEKLNDYTKFASILQQDRIELSDIAEMPTSLFQQGLAQINYINNYAANIANAEMGQAVSSNLFQGDQNIQMIANQKMYENARKQLQKQLAARLNEEEKSLQARKTRLEAQLTAIQQEEQACTQQISNGIKNQVSTFGLQG